MKAWLVILNGKVIDTVYFNNDLDAWYVKRSLVDHDGMDPHIRVTVKDNEARN